MFIVFNPSETSNGIISYFISPVYFVTFWSEEINESNNEKKEFEQLDLFSTVEEKEKQKEETKKKLESEKNIQDAILNIKNKFGKNAILKGMNFEEGGTMIDRNSQNGGHAE